MYRSAKKPKKLNAVRQPMALTRRRRDFRFIEHACCEECSTLERLLIEENPTKFVITEDAILMPGESPYLVPLYLEFKRKNDDPNDCGYLTPCGIELYDYASIYRYLKVTKSRLNVNQFVLTARIETFRDHPYFKVYAMKKDISNGQEATPIQAINEYLPEFWPEFVYIKNWKLSAGSELTEKESVCGCSCEDDCSDLEKCECRQLTVKENKPLFADDKAGYEFNHLFNFPETAIYECNSNCSCKKNCLNRVVQNGIKVRLQVYQTSKRGWGIRCLHDIPKGTFICSYEGEVVKNHSSPLENDNPYMMNLNYDYCYAQLKNDQNSTKSSPEKNETKEEDDKKEKADKKQEETGDSERETQEKKSSQNSMRSVEELMIFDDIDYSSCDTSFSDLTNHDLSDSSLSESCSSRLDANQSSDQDEQDSQTEENSEPPKKPRINAVSDCDYLVDSLAFSNVARFLNHSCNPNLRCQPVFIESRNPVLTHMAFFTVRDIKAFTELTFNYFIGSLDEMDFDCLCKSKKCIKKQSKTAK